MQAFRFKPLMTLNKVIMLGFHYLFHIFVLTFSVLSVCDPVAGTVSQTWSAVNPQAMPTHVSAQEEAASAVGQWRTPKKMNRPVVDVQ